MIEGGKSNKATGPKKVVKKKVSKPTDNTADAPEENKTAAAPAKKKVKKVVKKKAAPASAPASTKKTVKKTAAPKKTTTKKVVKKVVKKTAAPKAAASSNGNPYRAGSIFHTVFSRLSGGKKISVAKAFAGTNAADAPRIITHIRKRGEYTGDWTLTKEGDKLQLVRS